MKFPTQKLDDIFRKSEGIFSIWGASGVGKTTFAFQIALNAANFGQVIYIYSKPNFPLQKVENITQNISPEILKNMIYINSTEFSEFYDIIFKLEFLILNKLKDPKITLIIIDSMTDLYRIKLDREKKEKNFNLNYQLNQMMGSMKWIYETYDIDVLIVNELSRINNNEQIEEIQSGGKIMQYWVDFSIKISRTEILNQREFVLTKHKENETLCLTSLLTEKGFLYFK